MSTRGNSCVKRDVCTFYGCGSTSDLCADCGHYLAEAVNTSTNNERESCLLVNLHEDSKLHGANYCTCCGLDLRTIPVS